MTNPFDLSGQVAIVTGANTGIGQAIALSLAAAGADIAAVGRTPAQETVDKVRALGRKAEIISADLSTIEPVQRVVDETLEKLGGLHILVNNAGIIRRADSVDFTEADWDAVIDTNLKAVFRLSRAAIRPMMKQRYGRIISITSVVGAAGNAGQANYAAAKAGVAGMTRALARELGSRNITVNCVAPGFIETDMTSRLPEAQQQALLTQIPLGHLGKPADIAHAVAYLASPQAAYVTGQELHVNGGMHM